MNFYTKAVFRGEKINHLPLYRCTFINNATLATLPLGVMVIAVNTILHRPDEAYQEWIREAVSAMAVLQPAHQFLLLVHTRPDYEGSVPANLSWQVLRQPGDGWAPFFWWQEQILYGTLKRSKADLFIASEGYCSLRSPVPQLLLLPSASFMEQEQGPTRCWYHRWYRMRSVHKAAGIVVFSDSEKLQAGRYHNLSQEKIGVVLAAPGRLYRSIDPVQADAIKQKYTGGTGYFFCAVPASKALFLNLLKAFSLFKKRQKSSMMLVLGGVASTDFAKLLATYRYREDVISAQTNSDHASLLAAAYAVVDLQTGYHPAGLYVKAMQCGVPVLKARPPVPEDGKELLYFDPADVSGMAEQLMLVYKDEALRNRLAAAGALRMQGQTVDRMAAALWERVVATINN